jgi:hypothetical protein
MSDENLSRPDRDVVDAKMERADELKAEAEKHYQKGHEKMERARELLKEAEEVLTHDG